MMNALLMLICLPADKMPACEKRDRLERVHETQAPGGTMLCELNPMARTLSLRNPMKMCPPLDFGGNISAPKVNEQDYGPYSNTQLRVMLSMDTP